MSSRIAPIRQLRLVVILTLLVITGVAGALPDHAEAAACDGVTVRVERTSSAVTERCAAGQPADGLAALESAGFAYTFVSGQPGFVCTIDRHPDPCNDAPADAYWSYWSASPGDRDWTYNTRGAGNRTPPPGSAEAWVFGDGRPPSTPPPAAPDRDPSPAPDRAEGDDGAEPAPAPAPSTTPSGSTPRPSPAPDAPSGSDDPPAEADEDEPAAEPTTPRASTGSENVDDAEDDTADRADPTDRDTATTDSGEDEADGNDTTSDGAEHATDDVAALGDPVTVGDPPGGGSIVGPVVGVTLVAGLAGAAVLRARRRDDGPVL